MKKEKKQDKIITIFIITILTIDQITKIIMYQKGKATISNYNNNNGYSIVISILIVIMIIRYISSNNTFIKNGTKIILSFAIAGAISNVIDRIWNKNVIVFIKIGTSITLNLSYIYIIIAWIGMAMILTKNSIRFINERKFRKRDVSFHEKNRSK